MLLTMLQIYEKTIKYYTKPILINNNLYNILSIKNEISFDKNEYWMFMNLN